MPTAEADAPPVKDPYAAPSQEERDRLAADVERRRRAEGSDRKHVPGADLEPSEAFKARIKALMESVPYHDAEAEEPVDDVETLRAKTFEKAWANSLVAARVDYLAHHTLDQLADDQQPGAMRRFVEQIGPQAAKRTLVIAGRIGSGKSAAAIAAGNAAVERGMLVRFVKHAKYLKMLRPDGSPADMPDWQIHNRFRDCDLLILDDLGAELDADVPATRFVRDETLSLIGDRIESGKATIVTTNEPSEVRDDEDGRLVGGLMLTLGERLLSRLSDHGYALEFKGPDRRGRRLSWG